MTKSAFLKPYRNEASDLRYNRLFCDNLRLYRDFPEDFAGEKWAVMTAARPKLEAVRSLTADPELPARLRILAFNHLLKKGLQPQRRELLGVILEAGTPDGLEVLAAYTDYRVSYIDCYGKQTDWEAGGPEYRADLVTYFRLATILAERLKPADQARFTAPFAGMVRLTLLLSDGRYLGQGPENHLKKDPLSGPIIRQATRCLAKLQNRE